jgi:hypothetical protein
MFRHRAGPDHSHGLFYANEDLSPLVDEVQQERRQPRRGRLRRHPEPLAHPLDVVLAEGRGELVGKSAGVE